MEDPFGMKQVDEKFEREHQLRRQNVEQREEIVRLRLRVHELEKTLRAWRGLIRQLEEL